MTEYILIGSCMLCCAAVLILLLRMNASEKGAVRRQEELKQEIRELEKFLAADAGFPDQIRDLYLAFPERARKYIDAADLPDGELEQNWRDTAF